MPCSGWRFSHCRIIEKPPSTAGASTGEPDETPEPTAAAVPFVRLQHMAVSSTKKKLKEAFSQKLAATMYETHLAEIERLNAATTEHLVRAPMIEDPETKEYHATATSILDDVLSAVTLPIISSSAPRNDNTRQSTAQQQQLLTMTPMATHAQSARGLPTLHPSTTFQDSSRRSGWARRRRRLTTRWTSTSKTSAPDIVRAGYNVAAADVALEWLWQNRTVYPHLCQLAYAYLCMPASSLMGERLFSSGGRVATPFRAGRLSDRTLRALVYLRSNGWPFRDVDSETAATE